MTIYLGAAPGAGTTYAMLSEAHRRIERGADVVVGVVETYGRAGTSALLAGLEAVPRRELVDQGRTVAEPALPAVLERSPEVVLVDELAHTNVPGPGNEKRWQDVEEMLDAGIDVISTLNVRQLESLGDVVERITGVSQHDAVPDEVVRRAERIELVDVSPETLRDRLARGEVYPPEQVEAALAGYFRIGNLAALRKLALLWMADGAGKGRTSSREEQAITGTRERIVVALTGGPEGDALIRRAARVAARAGYGDLLALHVAGTGRLAEVSSEALARQRALVEGLGGTYHQVVGPDVAKALLDFARSVNATQIVLGVGRRHGWRHFFGPGVGATVARESGDIDVHVVTHDHAGKERGPASTGQSALGRRRVVTGWLLALAGPPLLACLLANERAHLGLISDLLFFLTLTVGVALVGGLWPAVVAAVAGFLLLNWFFTPPYHTWTVAEPQNAFALLVFVTLAVAVATVVDLAARRSVQAARARAEAGTLSMLATSVLRGEDALPALLDRVRETFGLASVALFEQAGGAWARVAWAGRAPCDTPAQADVRVLAGDSLVLALRGRVLPAADRRVLAAFAYQAEAALDRQRLAGEAAQARRLAEGNRIRTALLAAVSHDLRTPLASIKASVSSLRSGDVEWDEADRAELLATIEESADRLDRLVGNLLDMSRLQTGAVNPLSRPVALDEVVMPAVAGVPADRVKVEVPEQLPQVVTDPGLLERAVANVVENAVRHGGSAPVLVTADRCRGTLELRVADRGPGVPDRVKSTMFEPFQRLGDRPQGSGVGLGLAVARGFTEAIGGELRAEDTPGGGLTVIFSLPIGTADENGAAEVTG